MEGKRVVTMFDYYEKREHSLLVLEYLQVSWCTCFSWWDGIRAGRRTLFKSGLFSVWSHRGEVQKVNCRIFHLLVSLTRFVVEMVKALIFIHDSNIVHLDLKPQNVMLVDLSTLLIESFFYIFILFYIFHISVYKIYLTRLTPMTSSASSWSTLVLLKDSPMATRTGKNFEYLRDAIL